jgi:hypothetical protein
MCVCVDINTSHPCLSSVRRRRSPTPSAALSDRPPDIDFPLVPSIMSGSPTDAVVHLHCVGWFVSAVVCC